MIDTDQIADFLRAIVGEDGLIEIRRPSETRIRGGFFSSAEEAAAFASAQALAAIESGSSGPQDRIWFGVAARTPARTGDQQGSADSCYVPRVFFVDLDGFPTWSEEAVEAMLDEVGLPTPSYTVFTGGGHHLYWLYQPNLEKHQWQARQKAIVDCIDLFSKRANVPWETVDQAVKSVAQVMQLPGVPNFKRGEDVYARLLDDFSTEEIYEAERFDLQSSRRSDLENFVLPERLVGIGTGPYGGQNNTIFLFASHAFVYRNLDYNTVLSEARAYFCNPETCDPPVPFGEVQGIVSRANAYNRANRAAFEAEQRGRNDPDREGNVRQEELSVPEAATWVVNQHLRQRAKYVEGLGLVVYSQDDSRFIGDVHAECAARGGLTVLASEHPEYHNACRDLSHGSRFSAFFKEVCARSVRVSAREASAAHGLVPLDHGRVLNLPRGVVEDRGEDPPFFTWRSPATEGNVTTAMLAKDYGAWSEFLESSVPDPEEREYLGRLCYYVALGGNPDRVFVLCYGRTSSGKNLFFESLSKALQDKIICPPKSMVCQSVFEFDGSTLLQMTGYRVVMIDEVNRSDGLDLSKVKAMTSDGGIFARGAYQKNVGEGFNTYVPCLLTNDLPQIEVPDEAFMNRLHYLEFRVSRQYPGRPLYEGDDRPVMDLTLKKRIQPHDVLAWIASHREAYEKRELRQPPAFVDASRQWFRKMDLVGAWAEEQLAVVPGMSSKNSDLLDHYQRDEGVRVQPREFARRLREFFGRRGWEIQESSPGGSLNFKGLKYKGEERL